MQKDYIWFNYDENWAMPMTTTQESLEQGTKMLTKFRVVSKKQLNFRSYPLNDLNQISRNRERSKTHDMTTSYQRDYAPPNPPICPAKVVDWPTPDPLFNRKTVNDFDVQPSASFKFMDDHLTNVSEARKKVNFLRQLRGRTMIN